MDGGAVGVSPMMVVVADVGLIGNIPWKLFIDFPFLRSIPEIRFSFLHQIVILGFDVGLNGIISTVDILFK